MTDAALAAVVDVSGLPWTGVSPKRIGSGSLVANLLCERHNADLSPLDAEASRVAAAMRSILKGQKSSKVHINGPLFERWVLKTAINIFHGQRYSTRRGGPPLEAPPPWLAELAFGRREWPAGAGLSLLGYAGASLALQDSIEFSPLFASNDGVVGTLCVFIAIRCTVVWGPAWPSKVGETARSILQGSTPVHHASEISLETPVGGNAEIRIYWPAA